MIILRVVKAGIAEFNKGNELPMVFLFSSLRRLCVDLQIKKTKQTKQ